MDVGMHRADEDGGSDSCFLRVRQWYQDGAGLYHRRNQDDHDPCRKSRPRKLSRRLENIMGHLTMPHDKVRRHHVLEERR
jgi:hypothetical protein